MCCVRFRVPAEDAPFSAFNFEYIPMDPVDPTSPLALMLSSSSQVLDSKRRSLSDCRYYKSKTRTGISYSNSR